MATGKIDKPIQYTYGRWTPKLYDLNTYLRDLSEQTYLRIGNLGVAFISISSFPSSTFNTMIEIRNLPFNAVNGVIYCANASGAGGTWTIQGSGTEAYLRPNFTGTINGGFFTAVIFGLFY